MSFIIKRRIRVTTINGHWNVIERTPNGQIWYWIPLDTWLKLERESFELDVKFFFGDKL